MGETPHEVLDYLRKHSPGLPAGTRVDDLEDVAVLLLWQWWNHRRQMLHWMEQVVKLGASRTGFAAVFGIRSTQGFRDQLDRLHALLDETGPGRPDEQAMRADRASAAERANRPVDSPERAWLDAHLDEYRAVAQLVVDLYMDVEEASAHAIAEVRTAVRRGEFTAESLADLGLAVEQIASSRVEVPRPRPVDAEGEFDENGTVTAEQEAEYLDRVSDVHDRIRAVVTGFAQLQERRRDAATGL